MSANTGTNDYRALVCIMLKGGVDGHDMILPVNQSSYDSFKALRSELLDAYGDTRQRSSILRLPSDSLPAWGMPPELESIHRLTTLGQASLVANVGPRAGPINRRSFIRRTARIPPRLFSHNDQQSTWLSLKPSGQNYGWGGFFVDAMIAANPKNDISFSAITTQEDEVFLSGINAKAYRVHLGNAPSSELFERYNRKTELQGLFEDFITPDESALKVLEETASSEQRSAMSMNNAFATAMQSAPERDFNIRTNNSISKQLYSVLKVINAQQSLATSKQIFIVTLPGFDTHSGQASRLSNLFKELDSAVGEFYDNIKLMNLDNKVTLFTTSEFGRTLTSNGNGTDHGWGNHHFMVGGLAKQKALWGEIPPVTLRHSLDAGRGRLIPSMSIEEYAGALGQWWGLSKEALNDIWSEMNSG